MSKKRKRADQLLVEQGLAESRARAQALILAGSVFAGQNRVEKAGTSLPEDVELEVRGSRNPYVSRGGLKLEGALRAFDFDVHDLVCADFGASTGGFSDCLLQHGAKKVFAIDVGYGQLANKLRQDERIVVMERQNARHLEELPHRVDLIVIDASFIGMEKLLPAASKISKPEASIIGMVKPQFQLGKERVKGGVVRDDADRIEAANMVSKAAKQFGYRERKRVDSEVRGPKGNREIFVYWSKP